MNLSPKEVYDLVKSVSPKGTDSADMVWAASIAYMESSGDPTARNKNTNGSIDRGLWQWNDRAWPNITTTQADDPKEATRLAQQITKNWTDFTPWSRTKNKAAIDRLTDTSVWSQANVDRAKAILADMAKVATDGGDNVGGADGNGWLPDWLPSVPSDIPVVGGAIDAADAVGSLASKLIDPAFWLRIGIGVAGVSVMVIGVVWVFRDTAIGVVSGNVKDVLK